MIESDSQPNRHCISMIAHFAACLVLLLTLPGATAAQDYEILSVRYGTIADFPLRGLLPDAPADETLDVALAVWVIRNDDRVVLFDTGFFREQWFERFDVQDFVRPDRALSAIGLAAGDITDIVLSHAHWDHMGGLELFPAATAWIQADEFAYYTGPAWQPDGNSGGIDPADVLHLVERNTEGLVRLIDGDGIEFLPGITAFTGARHTYASQYLMVGSEDPYVLASDNAYLYRNLTEGRAGATFTPEDRDNNLAAVRRMIELAGDVSRVVPGHDAEQFRQLPPVAEGVVRIKSRGMGSGD